MTLIVINCTSDTRVTRTVRSSLLANLCLVSYSNSDVFILFSVSNFGTADVRCEVVCPPGRCRDMKS